MQIPINELIYDYRLRLRQTQYQFADALSLIYEQETGAAKDIDRTTISKWEAAAPIPPVKYAKSLAILLKLDLEAIFASIDEAKRRQRNEHEIGIGNYELFQWSYRPDSCIMKTNIRVYKDKKKLRFVEDVKVKAELGVVQGTVTIEKDNLKFNGNGHAQFVECETILIEIPRDDLWVPGIVLGITSDKAAIPTASRVIVKFLGNEDFPTPPKYETIKEIELDQEHKKFLSMPINVNWPVLSASFKKR